MGKIRNLTKVLQRLEELFRRDRDKLVAEAIKEELVKKREKWRW
jgi:predicted transcriptional regulator